MERLNKGWRRREADSARGRAGERDIKKEKGEGKRETGRGRE